MAVCCLRDAVVPGLSDQDARRPLLAPRLVECASKALAW
jgi:hypothetical protein